jgi:restriction endonuclease S subunit
MIVSGWGTKKLGEICKTSSGGTPSRKNKNFYDGDIPWVKSGELNFNTIRDTEEKISDEAIKESSAKIFPKETLLIALYGATVGKLAFLGIDAATNQAVCAIMPENCLENKYLYWYLFSKRKDLVGKSIGGAQPNISQTILNDVEIPIPPLPTQNRIVEKIEELFSELDNGVENLKKAQKQLKTYRQAVLKDAFEGQAHQRMAGAARRPPHPGRTPPTNQSRTQSPPPTRTRRMGKGSGAVGEGWEAGEETEEAEELMYILNSPIFNRVLDKIKSGINDSGVNLTQTAFLKIIIPVPGVDEQKEIVNEIESRLSVVDQLEQTINENLQKAEALRQSILKKAFGGELISNNNKNAYE